MLLKKEEVEAHLLMREPVAILLFLNALFVIVAYGLAVATGLASVEGMKLFRTVFLFGSFGYLILFRKIKNPVASFDSGGIPFLFSFIMLFFTLTAADIFDAVNKVQTFVIPFLYIYISLSYLINKFDIRTVLKGLHWATLLIYAIPPISYIVFGGSLSKTNIYGYEAEGGQVFVSNHYGWASVIYILSFIYVLRNYKVSRYFFILLSSILIVAVILLFTSANRAALFSMSITFIPLFFRYKGLKIWHKFLIILVLFGILYFFLGKSESGINFILEKSVRQESEGEARFQTASFMVDYLNKQPALWLTGIGIFNYSIIDGKTNLSTYHNSYWEVLFGVGIPLFLVFLSFMVFRPLYRFIKYYSKYTLLFAPLLIIPFFESNLTAGQFLFYPWFTYMLLLNAKIKFWDRGNANDNFTE